MKESGHIARAKERERLLGVNQAAVPGQVWQGRKVNERSSWNREQWRCSGELKAGQAPEFPEPPTVRGLRHDSFNTTAFPPSLHTSILSKALQRSTFHSS
jgi:hypothetical protein